MAEKLERQIALNNLNIGTSDITQANAVQQCLANTDQSADLIAELNSYNGR